MERISVRTAQTLSLFVVIAAMLAMPQIVTAQGREAYGVVTSPQFLNNDVEGPGLDRIQELGVGSIRTSIAWSAVQPNPNGPFEWGWIDEHIENAYDSGLHVFASLDTPPSWAAACEYCVPYSMSQWYTYVRAVIEHYSWMGNRITYGVWNEPNDNHFLRVNPSDAGHYQVPASRYVPLVQNAIWARNDSGTGAAFALSDATTAAVGTWWWDFYSWQGIGAMMAPQDKIAVHWYPGGADLHWYLQWITDLTGREVWLTETGPLTPTSDSNQVSFINDLVNRFQSRPGSLANWTRLFYYRIWDGEFQKEALLLPNWNRRPGFDTYRNRISAAVGSPSMTMAPGDSLSPNEGVWSDNGQYHLIYQSDGNLVLYQGGVPLWASGTDGTWPGVAVMQFDGNFVIYDGGGTPVFATNTDGNSNAYLSVRNDGKIAVYSASDSLLWVRP